MSANASVLVVGAAGFFGRLLVEELENFTTCKIIVAGRNTTALKKLYADRHEIMHVNLHVEDSINAALSKSQIAICAAGPFQHLPLHLPKLCIAQGLPYIDISDSRQFVKSVMNEAETATAPVCTGWSAVPALSAVLAHLSGASSEPPDEIHIAIAPGNRAPRSYSTIASLLYSAGASFRVMQQGKWRQVRGFSEPREMAFPSPVGRRIAFLVDAPDHDLFPKLFQAKTVEFRAGAELPFFNWGGEALSLFVSKGQIKEPSSYAHLFHKLMVLFGSLGTDAGALGVEVITTRQGQRHHSSAFIVAQSGGHKIPVMPAVIQTKQWLDHGIPTDPHIALATWIDKETLEQQCALRGYKLHLLT